MSNIELLDAEPSTALTVTARAAVALGSDKARTELAIDAKRLRELLYFDEVTGIFTRKARSSKCDHVTSAGDVAGFKDKSGYVYVKVAGHRYSGHRLAWLHVHGEWPKNHIDHIDGNPSNNAICNLRDVTQAVNVQNIRKPYRGNSNLLGVTPHKDQWRARIRLNGKSIHIGLFETQGIAYEAYLATKRQLHEGNTL